MQKGLLVLLMVGIMNFVSGQEVTELPVPKLDSGVSVEQALQNRRSVRDYSHEAISRAQLSQLLWACQGITSADNRRTAPSAGALYPLEIYVVVERVEGLPAGIYHYLPDSGTKSQSVELIRQGKFASDLSQCALGQECIRDAAVVFVIASVTQRVAVKYGERAEKYAQIEVGHAAQNICLQAQALDIGVVTVGAFYEKKVKELLSCLGNPEYILCAGKKK